MITHYKGYLIPPQCWPQKFHLNASINYDWRSSPRSTLIDGSVVQCIGTLH